MDLQTLDWIFPFVVLAYGLVMTFVLSFGPLLRLGEAKLPPQLWQQVKAHRVLALVSLILGGLWSLQNIWFQNLPLFVQ